MGLLGSPKKPMVIPWLLNRNGQCISLKMELKGKVAAEIPRRLKHLVDEAKKSGVAVYLRHDVSARHARDVDALLPGGGRDQSGQGCVADCGAAGSDGGEHEDWQDGCVLRGGAVECAGDRRQHRIFTAITTQEMWPDHPEKVCAFMAEFAEKNPKTVKAVLKALHEASVWLDDMKNRPEQCEIVSKTTYINCPKEILLGRLQGHYDYGDGRKVEDKNYMIFSQRNCNYPQLKYATWFLSRVSPLGDGGWERGLHGDRQTGDARGHL